MHTYMPAGENVTNKNNAKPGLQEVFSSENLFWIRTSTSYRSLFPVSSGHKQNHAQDIDFFSVLVILPLHPPGLILGKAWPIIPGYIASVLRVFMTSWVFIMHTVYLLTSCEPEALLALLPLRPT